MAETNPAGICHDGARTKSNPDIRIKNLTINSYCVVWNSSLSMDYTIRKFLKARLGQCSLQNKPCSLPYNLSIYLIIIYPGWPAACLAVSGPGVLHCVAGLANAK